MFDQARMRQIVNIICSTKQIGCGVWNQFVRVASSIALCVLFSFAISCSQTEEAAQGPPAQNDVPAGVTQIDDAKLKQLLKPSGKPLLVNFWATWCGPCREEFPDLVDIDKEYKGKIDFITISLDFVEELNTGVPQFLSEMKAGMPTYLLVSTDENVLVSSISKDWSGGLPFTILYDESGGVAFQRQGKVDHKTLSAEIEKTLAGSK